MNKIALIAAVGLCGLASALPASANEGVSAKGVVAALTTKGVSITGAHRTVTCALGRHSPSIAGFSVGDRVQAQCRRVSKHLVLARIHHLDAPADGASTSEPVKFGGAVTSLSDTSISLHDGDRDITCALGDGSPSTAGLKVGEHARVVCVNGVLVSWAPVTAADAAHVYEGAVTAIDTTSITLQVGDHGVTCTLGDGSPSLGDVHVGDRVYAGCRVGTNLLVLLRKLPATTTTTTTTTTTDPPTTTEPAPVVLTTAGGTITALSSTSLTIHNDEHGDISCTVTDGSPPLGDYHVGDRVGIACTAGILKKIVKLT
jgi:hypothetical protein